MSVLDAVVPSSPVVLTLGIGGSIGVLAAALALGIRHGIDWDHIAAITDITSTTAATHSQDDRWLIREPGLMLTDESHHSLSADPVSASAVAEAQAVVEASAPVAVGAGVSHARPPSSGEGAPIAGGHRNGNRGSGPLSRLPAEQRRAMFLGSLYALGHGSVVIVLGLLAILARQFLPAQIDPVMERVVGVTLVFLALYLFYSLYRFFRSDGEFRIRSRWMLIFAGVRNGFNWLRGRVRGVHEHAHVRASDQYGVRTAYSVGLIHGIGAETGTQVLVIATAVGAGTKLMGVGALMAFVVGLLISNSFVTIATTAGFVSSRRRQGIYVFAGALAAVFSLVVGLVFLFRAGGFLPDLDPYFHWIGGPNA
jgi:high-affinity nickel-transport protein